MTIHPDMGSRHGSAPAEDPCAESKKSNARNGIKNFAPKSLSREAGKLWREVSAVYELDASQLAILKEACFALDRLREAQKVLEKDGITCKDRFGQVRQHPASLIERDARNQMVKCLRALNLDNGPDTSVGAPLARI